MIHVLLTVESRYIVDRRLLRGRVRDFLSSRVRRDAEVSISIVGNRKMRRLNRQYRDLDKTTNVLSFAVHESKQHTTDFPPEAAQPDRLLRLGDVVVSYPQAVQEAARQHKLVDERVAELVEHGLQHLLGVHHG